MMAYCGQIATEDLKTLHPGVTGLGLCFIINVWLVTLIGLTNSLSTSNFSEMIKSVHVFMIKVVNQLLTCALLGKAFSQLFYSSS